jgi:hypothetical protein
LDKSSFTLKRLCKFVADFRLHNANMPTLADLQKAGFPKPLVEHAVRNKLLKELYADLNTGAVTKVYKVLIE